jgi:hypothetical protein
VGVLLRRALAKIRQAARQRDLDRPATGDEAQEETAIRGLADEIHDG